MALTATEIAAKYPEFAQWLNVPDVAKLLQEAGDPANDWTSDEIAARLHATPWWKATSEAARKTDALALIDPAQYEIELQDMTRQVLQTMQQQGLSAAPDQYRAFATMFLREKWTPAQISDWLVSNSATFDQGGMIGTIQSTAAQVKKLSSDYGMPMSDATATFHAKQIQSSGSTLQGITEMLREQAKATYAHLAPQLDAGHTVRDIAEPYVQSAAQLLELSPDAINISDPKWSRALSYDPKQTGQQTLMGLGEWQKTLMSDSQYGWDYTNNAKTTAYDIRDKLAQTMGVR